ncbi:MAG TPA: sirohydrochlorin chelatase [Pirellulales bacterium]|nr:sirohydrochlorin chelatase [Pirellulales bacterium]
MDATSKGTKANGVAAESNVRHSAAPDRCPLAPASEAVLLIGHGTRDPMGVAEFLRLAELVRPLLLPRPMAACFLELAEPTVGDGLERLRDRGARRITTVPVLLTAAGHAKRDIPAAVAAALNRTEHDEVSIGNPRPMIGQTPALDCHPRMVDLATRRYDEALAGRAALPPERTLLLLVGRGSSDAAAAETVRRFAALRGERSRVGRVETCFAAVAKPSLEEMLPLVAAAGYERIVVQPHLLFRGRLFQEVREAVARFERQASREGSQFVTRETASGERHRTERTTEWITEWIIAEPLGPEPELAAAIVDLVRETERR